MTTLLPDSWESLSYTAGDLYDLDAHRALLDYARGGPRPEVENPGGADVVDFQKARRVLRPRSAPPEPEPETNYSEIARGLADIKPYDPSEHPERNFYDAADFQHLEQHGFTEVEPGVWHRDVTDAEGNPANAKHIITYDPGNRRPTNNELAPWVLTTEPDTVGIAFSTLRGPRGAMAAANADREQFRRMSKVGSFLRKIAAGQSSGRRDADDWLARNTDESFEHEPEVSNEGWLRAHEGLGDDEGFVHWEPDTGDYTYPDVGDASGWEFPEEGEARPTTLPGHFRDENFAMGAPSAHHDHSVDREVPDDEDFPQHEQDLADLGFEWRHRGDPNTTPVGEYQTGEWVRHQHDPEGNHIATHTIHWNPSSMRWNLDSGPADTPGFTEFSTHHRFPSDAISEYHENAEKMLLPSRGYEPQYGRSGRVSHWTRVDHDPQTGAEYHHEISNQPPAGEGNHMGWLGQTFADHFPRSYAPNGARNQNVQPDLADTVREHDRIGRGLHPGGSQDYRTTREELLSDPSVARLGEPKWVDNFWGDGKANKALWVLPHPNPPSHTVFDPTAPGYARQAPSEHPWINAEATYNWDKGGYDFAYTHDGQRIWPNSEHFPAGAPVHVPGRQTQLPLEH